MSVDFKTTAEGLVAILSLIGGLGTPLQQILHKRTGQTVEVFKAEFDGLKAELKTLKASVDEDRAEMKIVRDSLSQGGIVMGQLTTKLDDLQGTLQQMRQDHQSSSKQMHDDIKDLSKSLMHCVQTHWGANHGA
jgi:TolA-binding protein